ncbi:MAG: aminotransferase class I/II-fold pyridoxal phosphate-dependent enzyme [Clostridia bacterium]
MFDFDTIINRYKTDALKWSKGDIIPLTTADMDFLMPDCIVDAIQERLRHKIVGYTLAQNEKYMNSIINWNERRYGWRINSKDIMVSHGVVDGVFECVEMLCKADEQVIFQTPAYMPYFAIPRKQMFNPMIITESGYEIDFAHLELLCSNPKNRVLVLCSPHNPTGRVFTEFELLKVADICAKHDVAIISDEIHSDWTRKGMTYTPILKLLPDADIITCISASKTFNLAGLELSNIIINDNMKERMDIKNEFHQCANPLSMAAAEGAFTVEGEKWLAEVIDYVDENLKVAINLFNERLPKSRCFMPQGTYMMWVDLRSYSMDSKNIAEKCEKNEKVTFMPGERFGTQGFARITAACPRELLLKGINGIINAVTQDI